MAFDIKHHHLAGAAKVTWGGHDLGYTRDGANVRYQYFYEDIKSDDYGGDGGMHADSQFLGISAQIDVELVKYDKFILYDTLSLAPVPDEVDVEKVVDPSGTNNSDGLGAIGTFMRQDSKAAALTLAGSAETHTFAKAFLRGPAEYNVGLKYRTVMLTFEAWVNSSTDLTTMTET